MKRINKFISVILLASLSALLVFFVGYKLVQDRAAVYELRGRYKPSVDEKTYLIIEDNNGGGCGAIYVDQKKWPLVLGDKGAISPGYHTIKCAAEITIYIKAGTAYYFNYWGP